MELTGHYIVPPDTRHKSRPVVRRGYRNGLVRGIDIKGMHKVPVRLVGNPFEQGTGPRNRDAIPTHVWHLQPPSCSKSSDLAWDNAETLVGPKFLTFLKQQLEPQTDAQKWFSRLNRCAAAIDAIPQRQIQQDSYSTKLELDKTRTQPNPNPVVSSIAAVISSPRPFN